MTNEDLRELIIDLDKTINSLKLLDKEIGCRIPAQILIIKICRKLLEGVLRLPEEKTDEYVKEIIRTEKREKGFCDRYMIADRADGWNAYRAEARKVLGLNEL